MRPGQYGTYVSDHSLESIRQTSASCGPPSRPQREEAPDPARLERQPPSPTAGWTHRYRVGAPWAGSARNLLRSFFASSITFATARIDRMDREAAQINSNRQRFQTAPERQFGLVKPARKRAVPRCDSATERKAVSAVGSGASRGLTCEHSEL